MCFAERERSYTFSFLWRLCSGMFYEVEMFDYIEMKTHLPLETGPHIALASLKLPM